MAENEACDIPIHELSGPDEESTKSPAVTAIEVDHHASGITCSLKYLSTYFNISSFAIIGCLIRIGMEELLGPSMLHVEDSGSIIFPSFFSNMLGSFILGLLAASTLQGMPGMLPVYNGLTTGMCGSITTYSKFNQQVSLMIIGKARTTGNSQFSAFAAILLGIAGPLGSFVFGLDISTEVVKALKKRNGTDFRAHRGCGSKTKIINFIPFVFLLVWITFLVISIVYSDLQNVIYLSLCAVMAPVGAVLRFLLAKLNKKSLINKPVFFRSIPMGTFLANFMGSIAIALVQVVLTWAGLPCPWIAVCKALQTGFCACLTTISTFVSEIHGMRTRGNILSSHCYPLLTIVLCEVFACVINGASYGEHNANVELTGNDTCV